MASDHDELPRAILSFGIRSTKLTAQGISAALGLTPTTARSRGELRRSKSGKEFPASATVWSLTTDHLLEVADFERHVEWMLEQLESRSQQLSAIRPDCEPLRLYVTLMPTELNTMVESSAQGLARLLTLADEFILHIGKTRE
jgi:hypothetical protein